jgi:hypothetical protein
MENTTVYKAAIMFGGGFLLFWLLKPKSNPNMQSGTTEDKLASFDSSSAPITAKQKKDAEVVMSAFQSAMIAGEPAMVLSELNRECMKDYGLKCQQKKDGSLCVYDTASREVLSA